MRSRRVPVGLDAGYGDPRRRPVGVREAIAACRPRVSRSCPTPCDGRRVPRDLDSVTTIAAEVDPADVGLTTDGVERIWESARSLYRSGIHPALTLCVRREGAVVLDRAIGHARGNGPKDPREAEKVLATPETPICIFSATKGNHCGADPPAGRARSAARRRPGGRVPSGVRPQRQGRHHHRPGAVAPGGHPEPAPGRVRPGPGRRLGVAALR